MIRWEFRHARDALLTGDYVTLYNEVKNAECARVGKMSRLVVAPFTNSSNKGENNRSFSTQIVLYRRCFCNHLYAKHQLKKLKNGRFGKNPCGEDCKCDNFRFMWRRPEEIGQNFLVRRKGFDINQWRPLCGGCKHPHAVHDPVRTKCKECHCSKFISNFGLYIMKITGYAF